MQNMWWYGYLMAASNAFYLSYVSLYVLALGGTRTQVGLLSSIASFFGMVGPLIGAFLSRKIGRRKPIVVIALSITRFMLLLAALTPFFFTGDALISVVIAFMALRLGFITVANPAFISLMGDLVPIHRRGRYMGSRFMAMATASMVFVPAAGWLIDAIGEPLGYQVSLTIAFAVGLFSCYMYSRIQEPEPAKAVETAPASSDAKQDMEPPANTKPASFFTVITASRVFLYYLLVRFFWNFSMQVGGPYFGVYQKEVLDSPLQVIGTLQTISAFTRMIGQRVWGHTLDRRGARWVFKMCAAFIPLLPFIWLFATRPWHIVFVTAPSGFLWAGFNLAAINLVMELPKYEHRTQAAAANASIIHTANIIGPLVGGAVIDTLGYHWTFALSGIGRGIGALLFWLLLKDKKEAKLEK
jgi:MFS family permease